MLNSPVHVYDTIHVSADSSEAKTFVEVLKTLPTIEFNADYSRKYAQPDPKKNNKPTNIFDDGEDLTIFTKIKGKKQETLLVRYDISIRNQKPSSQEIKKILTLRQNLLPLRKNPFEGYRASVSTSSQPEDVSNDQSKKAAEANDDFANLHWDMINRETILDCLNNIIVGASKAHQIRKDFYAWEHKIFDKEIQKEKQQTITSPKHSVKSILKKNETNSPSKAEQAKNLSILVSENVARRNKNRTKMISSFKLYSKWSPDVLKSFAQNYVTNLPFMKNMTKILNKEDTLNLKDLCVMSGSRYEDEKGANSQLNKVVNAINQELAVVAEKRSKNREIDNHCIIGKKARNLFNHSKWKKGFTFASSFTDSVLEEIATDYIRRLPFRHNMRYILKQKLKGNTLLDLSDLSISVGGIGNTQKKELVERVSAKLEEAAKTYQDRKNLGKLFAQHFKKVEYTEGDLVPLFNIQAGPPILNRGFNIFTVNLIYTSELESAAERIRKGLDFKKIVYNKLNTFTCRVRSSLVSSKEALFNYSMFSEQEDGVDLYLYVLDLFQTDLINRFESSHPEESNRSLFTELILLDRKVANIAIIQPNSSRDLENIDPKLKAYFEKSNIGLAAEDNGLKSLKDTAVKLIRKSCSQKKAWQAMYYDAFQDMIEFEEKNGCSNMDIYEIFKVQAGFDDELYKEFIKDIGVLKTCEEFMTLHFNVSRTIEKQLETKLKELERVRIQVFEGTGEAKKKAAKSIPKIRTEIKRLKLTSIKLSKMLDKEIEETPLVLKERKVKMLKRFRGHKLVKGSDTAALLKELEEMRKKLVALLGSEERLINIQNLYEKYVVEFRGEMSKNLKLTERDLPPQYVNMFRIFNEFLLNSLDDEDAFRSRNIKEILLAFINDHELNTKDPKEEGSQPTEMQKPQETQEKQEKQEEVQETTAPKSPATYKETLLSGYETIKQITTKELSGSNDATGDLQAFFKNSQTKIPDDLDDLFGQVWADDTVQQVDLTQKQDINGLLINQLPGTDINASENPFRTQEILTLTEDKLMPMLKDKIDQLKEEMEKAFAKFVADYEQQKDASSVKEFQRTIYINQVYLSSLEEKYSSLEKEKQAISYAFELYKTKYEEADANILLGFEKLSYDFKNERIEIQNKMDEIESRLFGYEQETTDVSINYRLRTHEDIAHFFRGFTAKSELKVVRDYFFQIQKTLKAYANNCVALEEDMFGLNNQILKVVPYGNAIAKIFKLYETSPEYKDKHIPRERNLRFSDLVPNMSKFDEIAEETALQLAMNKADLILKLSSNVNATMLKIDPDERYRYGLDTGSKVLAYIDASCIIANVYTGFLCPLELQDDPDDIYNTLPIISMFTESAKMVIKDKYQELLDLLDEKYHTNLCRVCGAHNNKSTFKVKTNNYVADPPHEAWGIDEIHVNICDGKCSKCQDKGVIKDVWNVKKTQTYKLQKLEHMWIDNIHPTAITSETITHNGRSLKVSKSEYEKNFRIKNELKPRPILRNLAKLDITAPLKSSKKPLILAMESDSENENEVEVTSKDINSKLENIANIDFTPGASDSTAAGLGSPLASPRKVPKLDNVTSPGASDSTVLGQNSPLASPRKVGDERKIVWFGSTKVYNVKNISDHVKEVEDEVRESSKKVNVGEVKKEHLRKIYGLKKIRS